NSPPVTMATTNDDLLNSANCYYTCNGKILHSPEELAAARASGLPLRAWPRLPGGKGGFGSLLRSIGSQIDKTTNREMCRDLSGRRMRDVNNQKRLAEWASGASARAAERQKRREEKRQRRRQLLASADGPAGHVMEDGSYLVEKERIVDSVFTAVKEVLTAPKKRPAVASTSADAPSTSAPAGPSKPPKLAKKWLDADLAELEAEGSSGASSSSSDSDTDDRDSPSSSTGSAADESRNGDDAKPATEEAPKANRSQTEQPPPQSAENNVNTKTPAVVDTKTPAVVDTKAPAVVDTKTPAVVDTKAPAVVELIDLSAIDSLESAEALGLDSLKDQLRLRGLKCGGSLRDRAQRLLAVRGLQPGDYPAALLAKPAKK
ncbi:hypothetical protein BOX15_Mlig022063g1, partial [Macrostomum lignano]